MPTLTTPPLLLRCARHGDAADLAGLCAQLGYAAAESQIIERLDLLAAQPTQEHVLVAETAGTVIGWIQVGRNLPLESGPQAEIRGLVVAADWRGRGVGSVLVDAAKDWARNAGLNQLRVRSRIEREATHAFYLGRGFVHTKQQCVFAFTLHQELPL